jgi:hypothetical protein
MRDRENGGVLLGKSAAPVALPQLTPEGKTFAGALYQALAPTLISQKLANPLVALPDYERLAVECIKASASLFQALPDLKF